MLEEARLDPGVHDRAGFDCGVPELNEHLQRFADQHRKRGLSTTWVLVEAAAPGFILGYYSLSAAQVDAQNLGEADRRKLPRYPVPCFRMGRLACRTDRRGQGLGKLLIGLAVGRCLKARQQVGAWALIVDAKDSTARAFYEHYGFTAFRDAPLSLYLPLGRQQSKDGA